MVAGAAVVETAGARPAVPLPIIPETQRIDFPRRGDQLHHPIARRPPVRLPARAHRLEALADNTPHRSADSAKGRATGALRME